MRKVYVAKGRRDRGQRAVKHLKMFLERHLGGKVVLDPSISIYVYSRKIEKPPRIIAVKFMKIDKTVYKASIALPVKR